MVAIETRQVTRSFGDADAVVFALKGIDLTINAGESVAITGRSGSGKSTLLHLLAGIDTPTSGQVLVGGQDLAGMSDDARTLLRRQKVGLIFQSFNLLPNLTAEENVALPLRLNGVPKADALKQAGERIEQVGLGKRRGHVPGKMSGGEQQRIAIARSLVIRPTVLLADEPTGNLDSENGKAVMAMLYGLATDQGITLVTITHDPLVAAGAGRNIHLSDGRIERDTTNARGQG